MGVAHETVETVTKPLKRSADGGGRAVVHFSFLVMLAANRQQNQASLNKISKTSGSQEAGTTGFFATKDF